MIQLIYLNIKNFIKQNKAVFFICLVSQIISCLVFIYSYYNYNLQQYINQMDLDETRTITLENENGHFNEQDILKIKNNNKNYKDIQSEMLFNSENKVASFNGKYDKYIYMGNYFSENSIINGNNEIILNSNLEEFNIGNNVKINNIDYKIIGIIPFSDYSIINEKNMIKNFEANQIIIKFKNIPNKNTINSYTNDLNKAVSGLSINLPEKAETYFSNDVLYLIFSSIILIIISIISFIHLYKYILNTRKKQYAILRLVGCNKKQGFIIYLSEILLFSTASFIISFIIYLILLKTFLIKLEPLMQYVFNFKDLIIIFLLYFIILLIIFSPTLLKYSKKTPLQLKIKTE